MLKSQSSGGETLSTPSAPFHFLLYDENFSAAAYFDLHLLRTKELPFNDRGDGFLKVTPAHGVLRRAFTAPLNHT